MWLTSPWLWAADPWGPSVRLYGSVKRRQSLALSRCLSIKKQRIFFFFFKERKKNKVEAAALSSIEALASVSSPAAVDGQRHHGQHAEAHRGEEDGDEELHSAHPFLLDLDCRARGGRSRQFIVTPIFQTTNTRWWAPGAERKGSLPVETASHRLISLLESKSEKRFHTRNEMQPQCNASFEALLSSHPLFLFTISHIFFTTPLFTYKMTAVVLGVLLFISRII